MSWFGFDPLEVTRTLALVTSGLFAGTCLYPALVAHPVRLNHSSSRKQMLENFLHSLAISEKIQPLLHILSLIGCVLFTYYGRVQHALDEADKKPDALPAAEALKDFWFGITASRLVTFVFLLPILPYTIFFILHLNNKLKEMGELLKTKAKNNSLNGGDESVLEKENVREELGAWGKCHNVRTFLACCGFIALVISL